MLSAWWIHVTAFASAPWPASAAIGAIPGYFITGSLIVLYLGAVIIAMRPRTWLAEDELHTRDIGKDR